MRRRCHLVEAVDYDTMKVDGMALAGSPDPIGLGVRPGGTDLTAVRVVKDCHKQALVRRAERVKILVARGGSCFFTMLLTVDTFVLASLGKDVIR